MEGKIKSCFRQFEIKKPIDIHVEMDKCAFRIRKRAWSWKEKFVSSPDY